MNLPQRFETLRQDGQLALRLTRRSPLFFGACVLTLALGIGANGAVFSILQSVLLQPLPYDNASRLVMLSHTSPDERNDRPRLEFGGPMVMSVRDAARNQIGDVAAARVMHPGGQLGAVQGDHLSSALDASIAGRAVRWSGATVTPNFFHVLGVRAALGRVFNERDDGTTAMPIILSDAMWRRDFNADRSIVGRSITIGSGVPRVVQTATVVGVLPRGVHFTYPNEVEAWLVIPWREIALSNAYAVGEFMMVSRIRDALSMTQARRIVSTMPRSPIVAPADAQGGAKTRLGLTPMRDWIVGDTRPSLYLLGSVAALLLLVTCVTVSNGLLARIAERAQELAVRSALGAERSRVVQQLLVEGAFLAICGTVAGTMLAVLLQPILQALLPGSLPQIGELRINGSIVAFAAVMTAVTTILAAVAPAFGGTRRDAAASLSRSATSSTANRSTVRWRHALVAAQASLTTMLLIFSALLLTSLWRLGRVPLGFDPNDVIAVDVQLLDTRYVLARTSITDFQSDLLREVRAVPGVIAAGLTSAIPFRGFDAPARVNMPETGRREDFRVRYVDSAFFSALRVPLLRGRLLNSDDRAESVAVAVISESFAQRLFGNANPIGKVVTLDRATQIVGVVGNVRYNGLDQEASSAIYVSTLQYPRPLSTLVVRMNPTTKRASVIDGIRRALHAVDPALPAVNVALVDQVVDATIAGRRFYTVATGAFAVLALTLTTVGLVLVVARAVAERRRELAIRSALGATLIKLARAALGDAMIAIVAGVLAGLIIAGAASVLLAQFLFQIQARSPNAYIGAAALVICVAAVAAMLPMRRFAGVPLAQMLRQD